MLIFKRVEKYTLAFVLAALGCFEKSSSFQICLQLSPTIHESILSIQKHQTDVGHLIIATGIICLLLFCMIK